MSRQKTRRPIGEILRKAGFISEAQLEHALEEQTRTNELLGQVLVRMGLLEEGEIRAALSIQEHLASLDQAVRLAAGVRQMLGSLLLSAGKLSQQELDKALAEQKKKGGKLGEVCVGLGLLSQQQLDGLLAFQEHQGGAKHPHPLRLGELLVTAGYISREHLDDALRKQEVSRKKLGEVLVEEGYAHPSDITHGVRMQHLLMTSVLAAIVSLTTLTMSGCGGGAQTAAAPTAVSSQSVSQAAALPAGNYFTMAATGYPLIAPTFYYSTNNQSFWSIQANVAKSVTDIDTVCVFRIDIEKNGASLPDLNKTFAIEEGASLPKFPGSFQVLNGQKSTNKKVERGIVSFSPDSTAGGKVTGTYDVTLIDYDSSIFPPPQYRLTGAFHFVVGSYGPAAS